jgi:hypothetical protein
VDKTDFETKWSEVSSAAMRVGGINTRRLTGHDEMGSDLRTPSEVTAMKDRVFGTRSGATEMFWYHATMGIVSLPATGDITHRMVEENPRRFTTDPLILSVLKDTQGIMAFGRVENRTRTSWVHVVGHKGAKVPSSVIRALRRRWTAHSITDGHGREIFEQISSFISWMNQLNY